MRFSFPPLFQFLNNNFLKYGSSVMSHLSEDPYSRTDPMVTTLPIVTMCTLSETFGTGGEGEIIQVRTVFLAVPIHVVSLVLKAICVLPNNIVHQKFYLFLWFWLTFLVTATVILLVYRLALFLLPSFRSFVTNKVWAGQSQVRSVIQFISPHSF